MIQFVRSQAFTAAFFAIVALTSIASAQDDLQAKVSQGISIQQSKFKPLKHQMDGVYAKYTSKSSVFYEVIRWLEKNPSTAEQQRKLEIARLEARLEALKEVQSMTSGDSVKNVKATIETAHGRIEDVKDEQRTALRPLERQRSALKREFKVQQDTLEPIMEGLFRDKGDNEITSDLKRSYASFSLETCSASGHYKRDGKTSSACMLQIKLVHDEVAKEKLGKFDNKYPIVDKNDTNLKFLVNNALVTIYSSDAGLKKDNLGKTIMGVVDIDKLASMLPQK